MCISWTVWHAFINNNWYWSGNNRSAKWQLPRVKFPVQTIKFPFCVYECVRASVRACVRACVCVCVWRRVTCLFHGIKEQLKTEKMWQTIPILFDYHTNFSFSCLVLNLQWHNQTIAVYQISTIKQVHQFSKQFFTVHFFNKTLSATVTFSTHFPPFFYVSKIVLGRQTIQWLIQSLHA